jgi:elongation factor Tu
MCDIVDDKDLIDFTADDIAEMLEENGYDGDCPFAKGDSFAVLEGGEEFKKKYTKILTEFLFDCHDWFNK